MNLKNILSCLFCFLIAYPMAGATPFRTEIFSEDIRSLKVNVVDDWQAPPVIELEGGTRIEISFDQLSIQPQGYVYTLTHCNADWTPSSLIPSEYMSGLQNQYVDDYQTSFNTTVDYTNYKLFFPNENLTMRASGNYVVSVFPEHDTSEPILTACFSVVEPGSRIRMHAGSQTDKGFNQAWQQVDFEVSYDNLVKTPLQDLKVYVIQNNRTDNQAALVKPMSVQHNRMVFDHNPALIFEAGNEYRAFEMTTNKYPGMGIETIEFHNPYYHTVLFPDAARAGRGYTYAQDIDGRYLVSTLGGTDYDYEADYSFVHFYFAADKPLSEDVYVLSEAFNYRLDHSTRMEYDPQEKGYVFTALLKQGYYNYIYVTRKNNTSSGSTALTEGNYFQTENEYRVMVYYRPMGARYDRLIGMQTLILR